VIAGADRRHGRPASARSLCSVRQRTEQTRICAYADFAAGEIAGGSGLVAAAALMRRYASDGESDTGSMQQASATVNSRTPQPDMESRP